jgi:hypothetical protein
MSHRPPPPIRIGSELKPAGTAIFRLLVGDVYRMPSGRKIHGGAEVNCVHGAEY